MTEPVQFTVGEKFVVAAASMNDGLSRKGLLVGIVLLCIIIATLAIGLVWFLRNRKVIYILFLKILNGTIVKICFYTDFRDQIFERSSFRKSELFERNQY